MNDGLTTKPNAIATGLPMPNESTKTGIAVSGTGSRSGATATQSLGSAALAKTCCPPSVLSASREILGPYPEYERLGYRFEGQIPERDRAAALALAEEALAPCDSRIVRQELARLRVVTSHRDAGDALALTMAAYGEEFGRYPADVVVDVCRRRWKFWPSLAELLDAADEMVAARRMWLGALKAYRPPALATPALALEPATAAEIDAINAKYGFAPSAARQPKHPPEPLYVAAELPETIGGKPWRQ
jgi:hypothetical protein